MKIHIYNIHTLILGLLLLTASGCTREMDTGGGEPLSEGKYPLEFTSQMYGMELTRATTDNTWSGGEEIAIRVDGKTKKYTAATLEGKLTAKTSDNEPFYWANSSETKTVSAYYPYSLDTATVIKVQADQSGSGYQSSDALFAPATSISFGASTKSLTFQHLPAKVLVNLKNGYGVTAAEVQEATVSIVNQKLTAPFSSGTGDITPTSTGASVITPNTLLTPASGCQKSVQALLVPCQMQGKQFVKVTIGNDSFYYTPAGTTDANLTSGKVHTYEITVKRNGIDVKITESATWTNGGSEYIESTQIAKVGDYYYSDATFSKTVIQGKTCIGIVFFVNPDGKSGKIVSLDKANWISWSTEWVITGATSATDGRANMATIATYIRNNSKSWDTYPAFKWVAGKNGKPSGGWEATDKWYLPASNELIALIGVKATVNASLIKISQAELLDGEYYWSSKENYNGAADLILSDGSTYNGNKTINHDVRAISIF